MSAMESSFHYLESVPPHPEGAGVAIQWMVAAALVLCLIAALLVWRSGDVASGSDSGCRLVTFPNAGVPYQAGYQCADGTAYYPEKTGVQ